MNRKDISKEDREKVFDCANELQTHMFKGYSAKKSYNIISKRYDEDTIQIAMKMLKSSRESEDSPYKDISETITRCMLQLEYEDITSVEQFYTIAERAYKIFMNDEKGRAMPIVFMYVKGNKKLGICPITETGNGRSPMDYLKDVVYSASPDAYCFCAEASMSEDIERSNYQYGDITNDPRSKDIMVLTGNTKSGNDQMHKAFHIIENKDKPLTFKEIKEYGKNIESDKIP